MTKHHGATAFIAHNAGLLGLFGIFFIHHVAVFVKCFRISAFRKIGTGKKSAELAVFINHAASAVFAYYVGNLVGGF